MNTKFHQTKIFLIYQERERERKRGREKVLKYMIQLPPIDYLVKENEPMESLDRRSFTKKVTQEKIGIIFRYKRDQEKIWKTKLL